MKSIAVKIILGLIIHHSERLNNLLGDDIILDKIDEDELRDAYNTILRLHSKVKKERRNISKSNDLLI